MDCGISLFASSWWMGVLTWGAFVAVLTFLTVFSYGRRSAPRGDSTAVPREELERVAAAVEDLSRRIQAIERRSPPA